MAGATTVLTKNQAERVLVASPRAGLRERIIRDLSPGTCISEATGGAEALVQLEANMFRTLLLDRQLRDLDCDELVATIHAKYPHLKIMLLEESGDASVELSPAAVDEAFSAPTIGPSVGADKTALPRITEIGAPRPRNSHPEPLPGMIGTGHKMEHIYRLARLVAPRDTVVLIVGATGTGKELVARGIHALSRRNRGPFVVVNCAAIPESLLEAELFGFTRGAFTGAVQSRLGRIHAAHGGTLLLDEVGELPLSMQAKLLRFVQQSEVQRLGSADVFRVDARVIAATNADLSQRVRERQFREDLYYRLAVFPIELPPLRSRRDDILSLAQHFLSELCADAGAGEKSFSSEAAALLIRYPWPGNVRELQHRIERAFVLSESDAQIHAEDLAISSDAM
ncbi:MAG TPA: sigma-54 dependent transcriptional regulator [Candidatus Acidoferrales bacterium]|nr:sigma-54 dependent transcriptional regulator [Candidatus Acidoferrales bacterium]